MASVSINIDEVQSVITAVKNTQNSLTDAANTLNGQAGTVSTAIGGDSAAEFQSRFQAWVKDITQLHDHLTAVVTSLNQIVAYANDEITTIKGLVN